MALKDAQVWRGKHFLARLKHGRLRRTGPFTDMQRMYRGKLEQVLRVKKAQEAAAARDAAAAVAAFSGPAEQADGGMVGLTPASSDSTPADPADPADPVDIADLRLPAPRAPREDTVSLTIVATKARVSKLAVERRRAINRVRAAWQHVIAHSPHCPVSRQHTYFLHLADGRVYDAVPFRALCEEAEAAITSFARAIIARESGARKRADAGDRRGGHAGGNRNAERRDLAKKKQIWKGTGVH